MRLKLKELIRRAISRRKNDQLDRPNKDKQSTNATAAVAPKTRTPSKLSSAGQRHSVPQENGSSRKDGSHIQLPRKPVQRRSSHHENAHVAGHSSSQPGPEEVDRSIAEDYEAYLPAISHVKDHNNAGPLNDEHVTKSRGEVARGIDTVHSEGAVGDTSFDSTLLNFSSRTNSRPSASSASSTYSEPPKDLEKKSHISTSRTNGEALPAQDTIRIVSPQNIGSQNLASVDDSAEKVLDEQIKSLGGHGILNSVENDISHFDEHQVQAPVTTGFLHRSSTDNNVVGTEPQDVFDDQTKVPEGFDLSKLDGIVDLKDSVDVDKKTQIAPAVQHETIKPKEHEIVEERIYREIHNHDVYHRILPVHDVEILPARHFVHDSSGKLIEVSGDPFPHLGGIEKRWEIVKKKQDPTELVPQRPRQMEPKIISDEVYMTEEGYPRRETTIIHPPELEDLTGYEGPVMPIMFTHFSPDAPERTQPGIEKSYNSLPSTTSPWLRDLMNGLPSTIDGSDSSSSVYTQATSAIAMR